MKKKVIYINLMSVIFLVILLVLFKISLFKINQWKNYNDENKEIQEVIQEKVIAIDNSEKKNDYEVNFTELKNINSDVIGWLDVPGTSISYPVVHTDDNSYYLKHNFYKKYNPSGWIFADQSNVFDENEKNIVIYGHNVRDGSMFNSLKNVINEDWYNNKENYNIKLTTEKAKEIYKVFSVYQIEAEDYYIQTKFDNNTEFKSFVETLQKRSLKNFGEVVEAEDNILTLSTCANNNKYRVVLHAKRVIGEDFFNYD